MHDGSDGDSRHAFSVRCVQDGNDAEEKEKRRIESLSTYFTDSRDGRVYRAVTIGANMWMAQNLNYKPNVGGSWCYGDNDSNCAKYGRLYDMGTATVACPPDWHLPSRKEWNMLWLEAGGEIENHYWMGEHDVTLKGVSRKLKAKIGWKNFGYGTDDYGFSALAGGRRLDGGGFAEIGSWGAWWTSSTGKSGGLYHRRIFDYGDIMNETSIFTGSASSVRCVRERSDISEWKLKREEELKEKEAARKRLEKEDAEITEKLSTYFTDARDGRKYRAVNIGANTWMAENLNYQPKTDTSPCYKNESSNCDKYGRLYNWETAKTACPSGWRLPSAEEWDTLAQIAGGERKTYFQDTIWFGAAKKLKAKSGWDNNGNGTDDYRFSALPGGYCYSRSVLFTNIGERGRWWTSTEGENNYAAFREMKYQNDGVHTASYEKRDYMSVRCVKDDKPSPPSKH